MRQRRKLVPRALDQREAPRGFVALRIDRRAIDRDIERHRDMPHLVGDPLRLELLAHVRERGLDLRQRLQQPERFLRPAALPVFLAGMPAPWWWTESTCRTVGEIRLADGLEPAAAGHANILTRVVAGLREPQNALEMAYE